MPGETFPVLCTRQRAINPGRRHFQRPGSRNGIINVKDGAHDMTDLLAILHVNEGAIGTVGHNLDGWRFTSQHRQTNELKAHIFKCGRNLPRDARFKAVKMRKISFQRKKGGPLRPPPRTMTEIKVMCLPRPSALWVQAFPKKTSTVRDTGSHALQPVAAGTINMQKIVYTTNSLVRLPSDTFPCHMTLMNGLPEPDMRLKPREDSPQERSPMAMAAKVSILAAALLGTGYLATHNLSGRDATPVAAASSTSSATGATTLPHALAQVTIVSPENAARVLANSQIPPSARADILAAVKRREMRLSILPMRDATGAAGQIVTVTSSGIAQNVVLGPKYQNVVLPIKGAGQATIIATTTPAPDGLHIGAFFVTGPTIMPTIPGPNDGLILDLIQQ